MSKKFSVADNSTVDVSHFPGFKLECKNIKKLSKRSSVASNPIIPVVVRCWPLLEFTAKI